MTQMTHDTKMNPKPPVYKYEVSLLSPMNKHILIMPMLLVLTIGASGFVTIQSAAATLEQQQQSPTTATIATQPTAQAVDIQAQGQQLEQFLEERTGYDIEFYVPLSWSGVVEALRFGQADVAMMTGWASYLAVNRANATL